MLKLKPAAAWTIRINVEAPQLEPGSYITGRLVDHDRATRERITLPILERMTELKRQQDDGEIAPTEFLQETNRLSGELLRANYVGFDGVPGDDAWSYVLDGPLSQWLVAAAHGAIQDSIERSRRGNSSASRGR